MERAADNALIISGSDTLLPKTNDRVRSFGGYNTK